MESHTNTPSGVKMPEEFPKIIKDFVLDINNTFPEYQPLISKWWKEKAVFNSIENLEEREKAIKESQDKSILFLFNFCVRKFPPRFFDILYQNDDIFGEESETDTEFLPHIHFKNLWEFDISDKTRETIWKYLQLILFCITGSLENREAFGDSAKLFESINEEEFKSKLEETLNKMHGLFDNTNTDVNESEEDNFTSSEAPGINMDNLPNAERIHEHITGMLDGKLGQLAKEIAEETASELDMDMENVTDMKDVFSKLMKNPTKLMGLVKNVGSKLDNKIKSGEIKESELLSEASDILNRMKNMPGMDNLQEMLGKMGMGGKGAKVDMNAMEAQLNRNMKKAEMKERIKKKSEMKKAENAFVPPPIVPNPHALTEEQLINMFNSTTDKTNDNKKSDNKKKGKSKK